MRVLPRVLGAPDVPAARSVVLAWVTGLGAVPGCSPCASLAEGELHLKPPVTWLSDEALGAALAGLLRDIHREPAGGGAAVLCLADAERWQPRVQQRADLRASQAA